MLYLGIIPREYKVLYIHGADRNGLKNCNMLRAIETFLNSVILSTLPLTKPVTYGHATRTGTQTLLCDGTIGSDMDEAKF